jgi:hypothetical protein
MARRNRTARDGKCKGFVITLDDGTVLNFKSEHYAEHVLRGLIHSGYTVTIREAIIDYPEGLRELDEWDNDGYCDQACELGPAPTPRVDPVYSVGATLQLTDAPVTDGLLAFAQAIRTAWETPRMTENE